MMKQICVTLPLRIGPLAIYNRSEEKEIIVFLGMLRFFLFSLAFRHIIIMSKEFMTYTGSHHQGASLIENMNTLSLHR